MANTPTADGSSFKSDLQGLGRGVDTLRADVGNLAHGAADAARSGMSELREGAHHAVDVAKSKLGDAKDAAADAAHSLKGVIVRHPVTSIGIAAGVGILIGMVLSRSRS